MHESIAGDWEGFCRERIQESEAFKEAEQKRFDLIKKSLEEAAASKKEVWQAWFIMQP
jgi:hypothetical protein